MQVKEDWDVYFCHVNNNPASIRLNLALSSVAPIPGLGHMAYVRVLIRDPDENGLVKREEFETMCAVEDAIIDGFSKEGIENVLFVGCVTTDGARDFVFYTSKPENWEERAAGHLAGFSEYEFAANCDEDENWNTYFEFLYPDVYSMNVIMNRRVRRQLEEGGDQQDIPREIDHYMLLSSQEGAEQAAEKAKAEGFTVVEIKAPEDGQNDYMLSLKRVDAPVDIDSVGSMLIDIAQEYDGYYDGWGTTICKPE